MIYDYDADPQPGDMPYDQAEQADQLAPTPERSSVSEVPR